MKSGMSFNDIESSDYYGMLSVMSDGGDRISGEDFFNSI